MLIKVFILESKNLSNQHLEIGIYSRLLSIVHQWIARNMFFGFILKDNCNFAHSARPSIPNNSYDDKLITKISNFVLYM